MSKDSSATIFSAPGFRARTPSDASRPGDPPRRNLSAIGKRSSSCRCGLGTPHGCSPACFASFRTPMICSSGNRLPFISSPIGFLEGGRLRDWWQFLRASHVRACGRPNGLDRAAKSRRRSAPSRAAFSPAGRSSSEAWNSVAEETRLVLPARRLFLDVGLRRPEGRRRA